MKTLQKWAEQVSIQNHLKLRFPGSKHQKQIRTIHDLVMEGRINPSEKVRDELLTLKMVPCRGKSDYVVYCRYLQYAINVLKNEGK
jgi:hypothetical protein